MWEHQLKRARIFINALTWVIYAHVFQYTRTYCCICLRFRIYVRVFRQPCTLSRAMDRVVSDLARLRITDHRPCPCGRCAGRLRLPHLIATHMARGPPNVSLPQGVHRHRSRSRPHPRDHQFRGTYVHTHPHVDTNTVVFALAMAHNNPRDRRRLQTMCSAGMQMITVSENLHSCGTRSHVTCNFASARGHRHLAGQIRTSKTQYASARILILLDYFWLPTHYYESNYGMRWLESGAHALLAAGADEVLLPFDNGSLIRPGESDMAKMLAGSCHESVLVEFTTCSGNPLWLATARADELGVLDGVRGGSNAEQTRNWLDIERPFVRCTLRTPSV